MLPCHVSWIAKLFNTVYSLTPKAELLEEINLAIEELTMDKISNF